MYLFILNPSDDIVYEYPQIEPLYYDEINEEAISEAFEKTPTNTFAILNDESAVNELQDVLFPPTKNPVYVNYEKGIRLYNKDKIKNVSDVLKIKNPPIINNTKNIRTNYDIVFLSYNENSADQHYERLLSICKNNNIIRVDGVHGIVNAHKEAASRCDTEMFYVVDADAYVYDHFNFSFIPDNKQGVYVWRAKNSANKLIYGYGGVKLFNTKKVLEFNDDPIDFTTTVGESFHIMDEVSNVTVVDDDRFSAWRAAFRETSKLSSKIIKNQDSNETSERLSHWLDINRNDSKYCEEMIHGANCAIDFTKNNNCDLSKINNYKWLWAYYQMTNNNFNNWDIVDFYLENNDIRMNILSDVFYYFRNNPNHLQDYLDAFSKCQLIGKKHLYDVLKKNNMLYGQNIVLLAGWIGVLGSFMDEDEIESLSIVDIDKDCENMSRIINKRHDAKGKYSFIHEDIYKLQYDNDKLYINTSCEHLEDIREWFDLLPLGSRFALQCNNNKEIDDHISAVCSLDEFKEALGVNNNNIIHSSTLTFPIYERYTIIGRKHENNTNSSN